MARNHKKNYTGRYNLKYTEQNLALAIKAVKMRQLSLRKASVKFGIPRTTLNRKVKGTHTLNYGGQKILNDNEESMLCDCLLLCAQWGFPMSRKDLRLVVKSYLDKLGRIEKRFKNNLPGTEFVIRFLKKKPQLSERFGENIKRARASVTQDIVNDYFDNLMKSLENVSPSSIVNYDETNFTDDPKKQKIIAKRGSKHPENVLDSTKTSVSVMMAGNADGELLPPYIVYKAENLYPSWTENGPQGCRYNRSKSEWFDQQIFDDWFHSLALPFLKKKPSPRVLIGDNLSSHVSLSVIHACKENDIRFILLPPNSTHICQPLDVAFFGPLKKKWRDILFVWKSSNRGVIPKSQFPGLLKSTIDALETKNSNLIAGFAACGIVPLDRTRVLKKLPDYIDSSMDSSAASWSSSIIDVLKTTRCPEVRERARVRGKKINVEPGKSVGADDSDSESSNDGSNSYESSDDSNSYESSDEEVDGNVV